MSEVSNNDELQKLIEEIKKGNRKSFDELYLKTYSRFYHYAVKIVDEGVAEEVVNDAMLQVWLKAKSFKGDSKVTTWIFGIVRVLCLKSYQKNSAKKRSSITYMDNSDIESHHDQTSMEQHIEAMDEIETLVDELGAEHRSAVLLIAQGMTYEDISEIEGCPVNTAKSRVFNARRILRDKLKDNQTLDRTTK